MGEVWKALDTRLGRTVAIKVLPQHLSSSAEVRQRFEREARTISALSHPHICALYDVGNQDGVEYLVMEYLEGETLADRLMKGALPLEATLRYGIEIADALDRAHRQGIVHRDLKPGNVMLTKSGVKLLDFGLARLAPSPAEEPGSSSALPTKTTPLTEQGTILGTVQYMAPEQLEGRQADARTDIFALGAVLYEMATGRKAFPGASRASLIAAIMQNDPPPISQLRPMTPPTLDRVVKTCLEKDPEDRWQSAADVAKELKWTAEGEASGGAGIASLSAAHRARRERLAWALAALAAILAALSALLLRRSAVPAELTRFSIPVPAGQGFLPLLKLSPDGRRIAFLLQDEGGRFSVAVRSLDSLEMRRVRGTEEAHGMFWSPDSREIAFFSEGKLKRVSAEGGPVETICEAGGAFSGAWSRQGTILFTSEFGAPIVAVPAIGGTPRPVTAPDSARGEAHFHPSFLPDDRHFLFVARDVDPEKTSVCLASLDSKEVRRLFHADSAAVFADPGYLLFARDNALFAWSFDPRRLRLLGNPVPVLEQVRYSTEDNLLSLSAAGNRLAYLPWFLRRRLVWVDRKGKELGVLGEIGGYEDVRISPDGGKVAVALRDPSHGQNTDVWVLDASRGTGSRITAERTDEFDPAWFPDGERLVYVSDHAGFYDLYERPASGGAEKILARTKQDKILPTVLPDGGQLLVDVPEGDHHARVLVSLSKPGDPVRLSGDSRFTEEHPEISPDGRSTAFDSTESGQREVYVQSLSGGPKRQVSIGGGQMPVWNRNGSEVFYAARDGTLNSVTIQLAGGRLEISQPQPLFLLKLGLMGEIQFSRHPYDVSPDGQRFLVIRRVPDAGEDGAVVVSNWTALLKKAG